MQLVQSLKKYLDKKFFLFIVGFYTIFTIIGTIKIIYFKSIGERFVKNTWSYLFFEVQLLDYVLVVFFMSISLIIAKYMVVKKLRWITICIVHLFLSILLGAFIFFGINLIQPLFGTSVGPFEFKVLVYYYFNVIDLNFLVYFSLVGIFHTYYYIKQAQESKFKRILLKKDLDKAKLEIMRFQIQPHFLMNTLTSLTELLEQSPQEGVKMVNALSEEFKTLNKVAFEKLIPIEDEIKLCKYHLEVMKYRKEINYVWESHGVVRSETIPPAIFHTALENGITHNLPINGKIKFILNYSEDSLWKTYELITVGKAVKNEKIEKIGTGHEYIISRLKECYGTNWRFESKRIENGWSIIIKLK